MPGAPIPTTEYARLLDLARYEILDSAPEEAFDRLTRLAARALQASAAIINFVDQYRQWGKSCFGTAESTAPREASFCAWTILSDQVLIVEDARQDARFQDNPQVEGAPFIRGYAGAPLVTPSGQRIGSICAIDEQPRLMTDGDAATLRDLASSVTDALEMRLQTLELRRDVTHKAHQIQALQQGAAQAQTLSAVNGLLGQDLTPEETTHAAAALIGESIHADWTGLLTLEGDALHVRMAHHQPHLSAEMLDFIARAPLKAGGITRGLRESQTPFYIEHDAQHPEALAEGVAAGLGAAAWVPLGRYNAVTFLLVALRVERGPRAAWRSTDRALLDAAGRSVRAALHRAPCTTRRVSRPGRPAHRHRQPSRLR